MSAVEDDQVAESVRRSIPDMMMKKRLLDLAISLPLLIVALPVIAVVGLAVKLTSSGPAIYWSDRFGRDGVVFRMPKFRSMRTDTPAVATHLLQDGSAWLTPIGGFLRKSSLDELPQLISILRGDMSVVGPRPALFNQHDLMDLRRQSGVDKQKPGLTGWAQVNGRDELAIIDKVRLEVDYMKRQSVLFDLYILWLTGLKVLRRSGVSH